MSIRRLMTLLVVVPLFACEANGTTGPEMTSMVLENAQSGPWANGSGHVPAGSGMRIFTFQAHLAPDGSVRGSYRINLTEPGLWFSVDVSCMAVEGNTAWVAGHISDSNAGFVQIGSVSYFFAIDNGEGEGAPADVISTARFNDALGQDEVFCEDRLLLLPSFPIEQGNVQVN